MTPDVSQSLSGSFHRERYSSTGASYLRTPQAETHLLRDPTWKSVSPSICSHAWIDAKYSATVSPSSTSTNAILPASSSVMIIRAVTAKVSASPSGGIPGEILPFRPLNDATVSHDASSGRGLTRRNVVRVTMGCV